MGLKQWYAHHMYAASRSQGQNALLFTPLALSIQETMERTDIRSDGPLRFQVLEHSPARRLIFFIHSIAANGNIGLSGQAHWLPVAVIIRNCAPKSPTVPGGHATTRVKQTSASKGPARRDSYPWYSQKGRKRHKCYGAEYCPYLSSG